MTGGWTLRTDHRHTRAMPPCDRRRGLKRLASVRARVMGAPACARPGHRLAMRGRPLTPTFCGHQPAKRMLRYQSGRGYFLLSAAPSDDAAARESAARQLRALGFPVPPVWRAERLLTNRGGRWFLPSDVRSPLPATRRGRPILTAAGLRRRPHARCLRPGSPRRPLLAETVRGGR